MLIIDGIRELTIFGSYLKKVSKSMLQYIKIFEVQIIHY